MNKQLTDEQLRRALLAAAEIDYEAAWNDTEPVEFSPAYLAWEAQFLSDCSSTRPSRRSLRLTRTMLIAAAMAAVLLVGCASAVVANPEVQETIRQIFRREIVSDPRMEAPIHSYMDSQGNFNSATQEWTVVYSDGTYERSFAISWEEGRLEQALFSEEWETYGHPAGTDGETEEYLDLGEWRIGGLSEAYVFEGCEHTYNYEEGFMASAHFKDWDKVRILSHRMSYYNGISSIRLGYWKTGGTIVLSLDDEAVVEELEFNGEPAYYVEYNSGSELLWTDLENSICFRLSCPENIAREEVFRIAESVYREA